MLSHYCVLGGTSTRKKINPTKGPWRAVEQQKLAVAIEISRPRMKYLRKKRLGIIRWGLSIRRAYCKYYTHKEINEGFKLGWRAEIRDHSRSDQKREAKRSADCKSRRRLGDFVAKWNSILFRVWRNRSAKKTNLLLTLYLCRKILKLGWTKA